MNALIDVALDIAALIVLALLLQLLPINYLITARAAGVEDVTPAALIGMSLRKVPHNKVVYPLIAARKSGVDVTLKQLEIHYLAGGNVERVVNALISARRAGVPIHFADAAKLDLEGQNVLELIQATTDGR